MIQIVIGHTNEYRYTTLEEAPAPIIKEQNTQERRIQERRIQERRALENRRVGARFRGEAWVCASSTWCVNSWNDRRSGCRQIEAAYHRRNHDAIREYGGGCWKRAASKDTRRVMTLFNLCGVCG